MTTLIGEFSTAAPECAEVHVPGCYNPWLDQTWCLCGDHQWIGSVPVLHARRLYEHAGRGAAFIGYDCYWTPEVSS